MHHYLLKADGDAAVKLSGALGVALELHERDGDGILRLERELARKHLIHNDADGIDISSVVGGVSPRLLGAYIMDGAYGTVGHGLGIAVAEAGDAEIRHLDVAV